MKRVSSRIVSPRIDEKRYTVLDRIVSLVGKNYDNIGAVATIISHIPMYIEEAQSIVRYFSSTGMSSSDLMIIRSSIHGLMIGYNPIYTNIDRFFYVEGEVLFPQLESIFIEYERVYEQLHLSLLQILKDHPRLRTITSYAGSSDVTVDISEDDINELLSLIEVRRYTGRIRIESIVIRYVDGEKMKMKT